MRHHSQRVPGKNYRPLAGKPLYRHILETLLAVPEIDEIVVDTDSERRPRRSNRECAWIGPALPGRRK
jgi:CMP-N-acetylneuraminic acid synthetase